MSRAYYGKRHYSKPNDQVGFLMLILLAGTVWAHKIVLLEAAHIAVFVASGATVTFVLLKVFKKLNRRCSTISTMTGLEFERYVAKLLKSKGYSHIRLTEVYDYGVDIVAIKDSITWGIQVKRYSGLVKAEAVRQVVTALRIYHCDRAMVITNSNFSRPAVTLADSNDCVLVDGRKLARW